MAFKIYCDGGVSGNGSVDSVGAYGAIVVRPGSLTEHFSGAFIGVTNNQMEMMGALVALEHVASVVGFKQQIILTSDSKYLIEGITKWIKGWLKRDWMTSQDQPVLNQELWKALHEHNLKQMIQWKWVKGHNGHVENELCDELASKAISEYREQNPWQLHFIRQHRK